VSNRWQFESTEAYRFCDEWIHEKEKRRRRAGFGWRIRKGVQRTGSRVVGLLNLVASVVSLATAVEFDRFSPAGLAVAVLNLVGAGFGYVRTRIRRPAEKDVVYGEPVDADAVGWRRQGSDLSFIQAVQLTALFAAFLYSGTVVALTTFDDGDGRSALVSLTPRPTRTPTRMKTPAHTKTPRPTRTATQVSGGQRARTVAPTRIPPAPTETEPPTETPFDPTETPTETPSPTATFTPIVTKVPVTVDHSGDEDAAADPNQKAVDESPTETPVTPNDPE
jgi:hypothetical protein